MDMCTVIKKENLIELPRRRVLCEPGTAYKISRTRHQDIYLSDSFSTSLQCVGPNFRQFEGKPELLGHVL